VSYSAWCFYSTTAGEIIALEKVENNPNGITEVRSHSKLLADGRLEVRSSYLQNGQWVPGHSATYRAVAQQQVLFK
jgi:hypothetical protein